MNHVLNSAPRPYRSRLREEQAQETRERILDATGRVMAAGIATVSIPAVAREAGVSIPLPLFKRNQGRIAGAEARIRKAEFEADAVRNDLLLHLTEAYRTFAVAQERVGVYRDEILPKADRALSQTNEGYKQGKFSFLDVLDSQRTLAEARIAYAAGVADLNVAVAELEKLTGTRLEAVR